MEFQVRGARLTDVEPAIRLLERGTIDPGTARSATDMLRQLLYLPAVTVLVAVADRRVVGIGLLSIRPSVAIGSYVGLIDELAVDGGLERGAAAPAAGDDAERAGPDVARALVAQLLQSARNKGCRRAEVLEPLVGRARDFWVAEGFAPSGERLARPIG